LTYLKEKKKVFAKNSTAKGGNPNSVAASLSADTLAVFFTVIQANLKYAGPRVASVDLVTTQPDCLLPPPQSPSC
jgi:hypothetical protein